MREVSEECANALKIWYIYSISEPQLLKCTHSRNSLVFRGAISSQILSTLGFQNDEFSSSLAKFKFTSAPTSSRYPLFGSQLVDPTRPGCSSSC